MLNHSLIFLALISFSMVSNAAVIPMDADQAAIDANQNAVLHKDVAAIQGGGSDKDVAEVLSVTTLNSCTADAVCTDANLSILDAKPTTVNDWFVMRDSTSALQPVAVLLLIIGFIAFFLSRRSTSTK
ncbi:MAG TPA: hypothetical protein DIW64_13340 [Cellvibrio sp.]|nr:hypothetical protein [Cellvibrio sp.]